MRIKLSDIRSELPPLVHLALPLIAGYAFHKNAQASRTGKNFATILDQVPVTA